MMQFEKINSILQELNNEVTQRMGGTYVDGGDYVVSGYPVRDARGHMKDGRGELQGKLPWHPTFSKESPYSTDSTPGGDWVRKEGKWIYTPSQWQVQQGYTKGLAEYFRNVEPDSRLEAPVPYSKNVLQ